MQSHTRLTDSRLANIGAHAIFDGFLTYRRRFEAITARARKRFEKRDWHGARQDATERLDLYREVVNGLVYDIRETLAERLHNKLVWASMKAVYSGLIDERDDWELAETFFNSITRRIFATVGVDPQIEFVHTDFAAPPTPSRYPIYRTYGRTWSIAELVLAILNDFAFDVPYEDVERDAQQIATRITDYLRTSGALRVIDRAEVIDAVFYRDQAAYLVGRLFCGPFLVPLVIALHNRRRGVLVDAVLLDENDVSILFSFARSYFHVHAPRPYDLVHFIKKMLPRKRIAELYISLGFNKHGKTELYRDLLYHLATTSDRFVIAPGTPGMVMTVFTMPTYDLVFKIIKDQFAPPKTTTRRDVMERYRLVFRHDRAGRLIDAQEFEHLRFDRAHFDDHLVDELCRVAASTVQADEVSVVVRHCYVERRLIPLDMYLQAADEAAAEAAVIEYGQAIKDLAAMNIFPGDMLLKNFGVTRHGRVVFYDYDELGLLTDHNFRHLPKPRDEEEALSAQPWFHVAPNDVFPEEFPRFWELTGRLREVFLAHHGDLFTVEFWRQMQERHRRGDIIHILPYREACRLPTAL
nr:bifunctional isocitrate dehydrogenase kinase/phosphatase [Ardenticatena sp.]